MAETTKAKWDWLVIKIVASQIYKLCYMDPPETEQTAAIGNTVFHPSATWRTERNLQ